MVRQTCEVCNKEVSRLDHHRPVHDSTLRFACTYPDCSKSYAMKSRLEAHIRVAHTKEKPFVCDVDGCDKSFPTHTQRMMHRRTHFDVKRFSCSICDKSFRTFAENYKHQFTHAGLRFTCTFPGCSRSYNQPYSLNNHCKNSHPGYVRLNP
jgi:uncharacterized Zn-finger protein